MAKKTRLNALQLVLLSHAATNENGSLLPLPEAATQDEERTTKELKSLLRRKLITEVEVTEQAPSWRNADDQLLGLQLTDAAREALGLGAEENSSEKPATAAEESAAASTAPRPGSKIAAVIALLQRDQGATLDEMIATTGWLPHTTRAALTGLRKKGHSIKREKRDEMTCYRMMASA